MAATIIGLIPCIPLLLVVISAFRPMESFEGLWFENLRENGITLFFGTIVCGLVSAIFFFRCKTGPAIIAGILALIFNVIVLFLMFAPVFLGRQ